MSWQRCPQHYTSESSKQSYATLARQQDEQGQWWVSPGKASERTGHTCDTLNLCSKESGCPALHGELLKRKQFPYGHRTDDFYLESQIERIVAAEQELVPSVPGFICREQAVERFGVSSATIQNLRKQGRLAVKEVRGFAKNNGHIRKHTWTLVSAADLEAYCERVNGASVPPDLLTTNDVAQRINAHVDYVLPWARALRLAIHELDAPWDGTRSAAGKIYLRKRPVFLRSEVDREVAKRQMPIHRAGRAFKYCNFEWLPFRMTLTKLDCNPSSLVIYRTRTCWHLDGRTNHKRVKNSLKKRRPVLAIWVSLRKGDGVGSRWNGSWFYLRDDVELALAVENGSISADKAARRAARTLSLVKATMVGVPVKTNFADLPARPPRGKPAHRGRGRPAKHPFNDEVKRACWEGVSRGDKLSVIRERLRRLYGDEIAPKSHNNVRTFAVRYAERNGFPLDRPGVQ